LLRAVFHRLDVLRDGEAISEFGKEIAHLPKPQVQVNRHTCPARAVGAGLAQAMTQIG
jgi:hypothetical protein